MTAAVDTEFAPKQPSGIRTVAVLLIQLIGMGFVVVTPAIAVFMEHFGADAAATGLPVTLISTLPTLTTVIGILLSGFLMGKVLKHRTIAIIATLLYVIFGTLPALMYNYVTVLICRALCGLGLGLMNPLANAIILGCYTGNKQASLLGFGTLIMNGGGIILQTLGGILAGMPDASGALTGQLVFWAHVFGIIAVIFAFLLPNPEIPTTDAEGRKAKVKIPGSVWVIAVILAIFQLLNYPAMLNVGTIMLDPIHMGDGVVSLEEVGFLASMALNMFTIFGMVAGAIFGQIFKRIKKWTIPLGFLLCAIGIACVIMVPNAIVMCIGLGLIGLGFDFVLPACTAWVGVVATPQSYPLSLTAIMIGIQLGSFLSTFWLEMLAGTVGDPVYFPGYIEAIFCVAMAVLFVFFNPFKNENKAGAPVAA